MRVERRENLPSSNKGKSEDARGWATATSNQQPEPQDPTPQRDRRLMRRWEAQGTQGLDNNGKASVSPLLRFIRGFRNRYP